MKTLSECAASWSRTWWI